MQCMKKVRSRGSGIREWELGLSKLRSALRWQQLEVHVERWLRVCPKELVTGSMGGRGVRGMIVKICTRLKFSIFRMFSFIFEELQFNILQKLYFGDDTTNVRVVFNLDESICLVVRQKGMVLAVLRLATIRIGRLQK